MSVKQSIGILFFLIILAACQKPQLISDHSIRIEPYPALGNNIRGRNFQRVYIPDTLKFEKEISLNGTPTPVMQVVVKQLFFTTYNGYLFSVYILPPFEKAKIKISPASSAPPAFTERFCFIANERGSAGLTAYDLFFAHKMWQLSGYWSRSMPLVADSLVYHASLEGTLLSLESESGKIKWQYETGHKILTDISLSGRNLVSVCRNGLVTNMDAEQGWVRWQVALDAPVYIRPVISDKYVFIGSFNGNIYQIDLESGALLNKINLKQPLLQALAEDGRYLYAVDVNGTLHVFSTDSLQESWIFQMEGPPSAPLLVTENSVLLGSSQRWFYLLEKSTGKVWQKMKLPGRLASLPAVTSQRVFLPYEYNKLGVYRFKLFH